LKNTRNICAFLLGEPSVVRLEFEGKENNACHSNLHHRSTQGAKPCSRHLIARVDAPATTSVANAQAESREDHADVASPIEGSWIFSIHLSQPSKLQGAAIYEK
jgi:hypothetical protein